MLYEAIQTELLQEPVFAHWAPPTRPKTDTETAPIASSQVRVVRVEDLGNTSTHRDPNEKKVNVVKIMETKSGMVVNFFQEKDMMSCPGGCI